MKSRILVISLAASACLALLPALSSAQEDADTIYTGGPILTINDAQPNPEAVAVKDGVILAVGALADVLHVDDLGIGAHFVVRCLEPLAGLVDGGPVGQVAAMGERQAHDGVAGLQ